MSNANKDKLGRERWLLLLLWSPMAKPSLTEMGFLRVEVTVGFSS